MWELVLESAVSFQQHPRIEFLGTLESSLCPSEAPGYNGHDLALHIRLLTDAESRAELISFWSWRRTNQTWQDSYCMELKATR